MIAIRGLRKSFGSVRVLQGIDLEIDDGEVVALIGRSGCGTFAQFERCLLAGFG